MAKKKPVRKKYSCDFETTTDPNDCRVWAWGWMEIGNTENYSIGTNIDDFMSWCNKSQAELYFHNLRFDGEFIVNWLLRNGWKHDPDGGAKTFNTIISSQGQWYMIDICYGYNGKQKLHTVIYDSYKKIPFPVRKIAKDFKLSVLKGDIDYKAYRPIGHQLTEEETTYLIHDIKIVAEALEIQFQQGLKKMTNGADAFNGFKEMIGKKEFEKYFPQMTLEMDELLRPAYKGGFTWLNDRYREKEIGEGMVFDVVSLYPSQMYNRPLPYGMPFFFEGQYEEDENYPLYIQKIRCEFEIKPDRIPTIQIKGSVFRENEYLKSSNYETVELYLTNIDLELFFEHYNVYEIEYVCGWKFMSHIGFFKDYIDKWIYIKQTSTGAIKAIAKLMLNSLYGKFATNPDVTGKVPILAEDGSTKFKLPEDEDGKVIKEYGKPKYLPMGIFITSWARYTTISTAQKCYDRIIYCDTDSLHLEGLGVPEAIKDIVHPKKLGYWAHESTFKSARYIRQKTYVQNLYAKEVPDEEEEGQTKLVTCDKEEATTTKLSVKCAGMPDEIKKKITFNEFVRGYTTNEGKLRPKHVPGGVVLEDTPFTIK